MSRIPRKKTASSPSGTSALTPARARVPKAAAKPVVPPTASPQRALVIGISRYPSPISKLPAVAADVREVAKVLASRYGTFSSPGVTALTERNATRAQVLASLKATFSGAKAGDTIFVYLAGHGGEEDGKYYYVAYDSKSGRLAETGVPLAEIKRLFDRTASRRVFLWLDFCHAGGITERGTTVRDDLSAIKREIGVVQGSGKIIIAACTPSQSAYEDQAIGHGLFTDALLRGLKGEARSTHGEVTALSLYEFIDREVKHPGQQPTLFGSMAGRIVLMHYPAPSSSTAPSQAPAKKGAGVPETAKAKAAKTTASSRVTSSPNLALLGGLIYRTKSIHERNDGKVEFEISPRDADEDAALRSLKGNRFNSASIAVAFGRQAFDGRAEEVTFHSVGARSVCTVVIQPEDKGRSHLADMGYNSMTPAQLAEVRARILLLDEKPTVRGSSRYDSNDSFIVTPLREAGLEGGIFPGLYKAWRGTQLEFLRAARLWAIYYLKASGTCNDVLDLALGPIKDGKLSVSFRGRRDSRYSSEPPQEFAFRGSSPV